MSDNARRVVLLARPGVARDRMREALDQAGADVVLEADPANTDSSAVLAARPQAALIVLDAATDEALERFDAVLADPRIEVLFEEAELAIGRVGWDAARWVRHLRAKLGHADSVLPPDREARPRPAAAPVQAPPASAAELSLAPSEDPDSGEPGFPEPHPDLAFPIAPGEETASSGEGGDTIAPPRFAGFELELVDDTPTRISFEGLELETDTLSDTSGFQNDMADLHARVSGMELVEDRATAQTQGAVLVLAGIGGPDAVRQLLGALPAGFPRAVLVQQRLDGGHYDKLVAQMQRATSLPVKLAATGDFLEPATVYILPPTLGVRDSGQGLAFDDSSTLLGSLPSGDSAVLMLSGSDPGQVDAVMKLAGAGALVAGQALDGCYDIAAPAALAARGGQSGKPQDLARHLAERWH